MIRCVPKSYGFAHVCDICETVGPIRGDYSGPRDTAEAVKLGIACDGDNRCSARLEGWTVGERDLCPRCQPKPVGVAATGGVESVRPAEKERPQLSLVTRFFALFE